MCLNKKPYFYKGATFFGPPPIHLKGRQLVKKNRRKLSFWIRRIFEERKRQGIYHTLFEELCLFDRDYFFSFFPSQQTLHVATVTRIALHIEIYFDCSIAKFCFYVITDDRLRSPLIAGINHFLSQRSLAIELVYARQIDGKCFHTIAVDASFETVDCRAPP